MSPKIYMHKESGELVISYPVYTQEYIQPESERTGFNSAYQMGLSFTHYLGDAVENKHGVTCIFHSDWKDAIFAEIGEL